MLSVTVPDWDPPSANLMMTGTSPALSGTGPLLGPATAVKVTVTVCPGDGVAGVWVSPNVSFHVVGEVPVPASLKYSRQPSEFAAGPYA
jgi:hypothetical protein